MNATHDEFIKMIEVGVLRLKEEPANTNAQAQIFRAIGGICVARAQELQTEKENIMNENTAKNTAFAEKQSAKVRPVQPVYEFAALEAAMRSWFNQPEEIYSPYNA